MHWNHPVTGQRYYGTEREMKSQILQDLAESERNTEHEKNPSGTYQIGGTRYTGITPEMYTEILLEKEAAGNHGKMHRNRKIKKMTAEASVTEAGGPKESVIQAGKPEEAELKLRDLLYSQDKLASKEAALRVGMDSTGGEPWTCKEDWGKISEMQGDAEEPLRMEAKAKKPKSKKKKMRKRREHAEDPIGSYEFGEKSYEGVTLREATKLYKEHMLRQDKLERKLYKEDTVRQYMLAGGRSLPDSEEQLANKNEKKKVKKNGKKNRKKPKAQANHKEEEAGKAETSATEARKLVESVTQAGKGEASVIEAGKPEESVKQAGKAEASVTETGRPVESVTEVGKSVTEASKAASKKNDASNVLQDLPVFEDAEDLGARFQSFWDKHFGHRCAYDETTTIPAMCYTHDSDAYVRPMDTLQVVSVKVASIEEGLHWPLQVYGMISVRDVVDRKRNIIFHRERDNCQTITDQDPYLTLTGPSRAVVVCTDPSYIEVVLKVKGDTESSEDDKELSRLAVAYRLHCLVSGLYPCELSTLEMAFSQEYYSVEATVHVKVTGGSWPVGFKGVFSAATARTESAEVKLLGVGDDGLPVDDESIEVKLLGVGDDGLPVDAADGMIRLSRRVVSVELHGMLKVSVSASGCAAGDDNEEERCEVCFVPQKAGFSPAVELRIGSCLMEATVAWSLFVGIY